MRNDNISVDQDMQKLTKQPVKDYCYYCGKTGHRFKNQNRVWTCPDRLANKPSCQAYIDYQKKHGYHVDETSAQTNTAEEAINTTVATVSDSSNRSIAVTLDVSFRGAHGWFLIMSKPF